MKERGIYLCTPDGEVVAELRYDEHLRNRQRWYRPWYPPDEPPASSESTKPIRCVPNNPRNQCRL